MSEQARAHSPAVSALRDALRRERLAARAALPPALHGERAARIETHLLAALDTLPPARIGFCAAVRGEFDAVPLVTRLLAAGWQACMPVADRPAAPMDFRRWTPDTPMLPDRHGIPVPPAESAGNPPDLLLLPLVAFDAAGYRLGYGGGYFDRTLAALVPRPLAIGVGFELGRAETVWPQAHDIPCDIIVTEMGLARTPSGRPLDAISGMQTS